MKEGMSYGGCLSSCSGLSFMDLLDRQGVTAATRRPPFVSGMEASGVIEIVGRNVTGFAVGDRVMVIQASGCHRTHLNCPETHVFRIPHGMSFVEAAAFPVSYVTAFVVLFEMAHLRPGHTIFTHSVAGGLGVAVCQLCRTLPSITVLGTCSADKNDFALRQGCDVPLLSTASSASSSVTDLSQKVFDVTQGHGIDILLDSQGGEEVAQNHSLLREFGTHVVLGSSVLYDPSGKSPLSSLRNWLSGPPKLDPSILLRKSTHMVGFALRSVLERPTFLRRVMGHLVRLFEAGFLAPQIDTTFLFEHADEAHRHMSNRRNRGRVLLLPRPLPPSEPATSSVPQPRVDREADSMRWGFCSSRAPLPPVELKGAPQAPRQRWQSGGPVASAVSAEAATDRERLSADMPPSHGVASAWSEPQPTLPVSAAAGSVEGGDGEKEEEEEEEGDEVEELAGAGHGTNAGPRKDRSPQPKLRIRARPEESLRIATPGTKPRESDSDPPLGRQPKLSRASTLRVNLMRSHSPDLWDTYDEGETLGVGMSGSVHLVRHRRTGMRYALKSIQLDKMDMDLLEDLRNEIRFLQLLDHPHVIKLFEYYETISCIHLVLEYCSGGELFERLHEQQGKHFTETNAALLVDQMLSAVAYCHRMGIAHRDLKLENFMFESRASDAQLKLIDFGLSRRYALARGEPNHDDAGDGGSPAPRQHVIVRMCTQVGTPYYTAPEVMLGDRGPGGGYDNKCDVWSIGVIAYMLLSGSPPFHGRSDVEILNRVRRGRFTLRGPQWDAISDEAKDFVRECLRYNPSRRPTAVQARKMSWFRLMRRVLASADPRRAAARGAQTPTPLTSPTQVCGSEVSTPASFHSGQEGRDVIAASTSYGSFGVPAAAAMGRPRSASRSPQGSHQDDEETEGSGTGPAPPNTIDPSVLASLRDFGYFSKIKRAALSTIAYSMSTDELKRLRDAFLALDTEGAGILTLREISAALVNQGGMTEREAEAIFRGIDHNHDEAISYSEFLAAAMSRNIQITDARIGEAFRKLDTDGTGYIGFDDLKNVMGDEYTDEEIHSMLEEGDTGQEGRIDYEAFRRIVLENTIAQLEDVMGPAGVSELETATRERNLSRTSSGRTSRDSFNEGGPGASYFRMDSRDREEMRYIIEEPLEDRLRDFDPDTSGEEAPETLEADAPVTARGPSSPESQREEQKVGKDPAADSRTQGQ